MRAIMALILFVLAFAPFTFAAEISGSEEGLPVSLDELNFEEVRWKIPIEEFVKGATVTWGKIDSDDLFLLDSKNTAHCIDLNRGVHKWILNVPGRPTYPPGISADSVGFVIKDRVVLVKRSNGSRYMDRNLKIFPATTPATTLETAYVGVFIEDRLQAIDANLGTTGWSYRFTDFMTTQPKIFGEEPDNLLYAAANDGSVICLPPNPALGSTPAKVRWSFKTNGPNMAEIVLFEDFLFVPSKDTSLYAFNRLTGIIEWKYYAGVALAFPVQVKDGSVFLRTDDNFFCLDIEKGKEKWSYESGIKLVTATDDAFYIWTKNKTIALLNKETGEELKTVSSSEKIFAIPNLTSNMLVISNGSIVFGMK